MSTMDVTITVPDYHTSEDKVFVNLQLHEEVAQLQKAHPAFARYLDRVNSYIQKLQYQLQACRQSKERSLLTFERVVESLHDQIDNQTTSIEALQLQADGQQEVIAGLQKEVDRQRRAIAGLPEEPEKPSKVREGRRRSNSCRMQAIKSSDDQPSKKGSSSRVSSLTRRVSRVGISPSSSTSSIKSDDSSVTPSNKTTTTVPTRGRSSTPSRSSPTVVPPSRSSPAVITSSRRHPVTINDISPIVIECIQHFSAKAFMIFRDFIADYVDQQGVTEATEKAYFCRLLAVKHFTQLKELNVQFPDRSNYHRTTLYKVGRAAQYLRERDLGVGLVKRYKDITTPEFFNNGEIQNDDQLLAEYAGLRNLW